MDAVEAFTEAAGYQMFTPVDRMDNAHLTLEIHPKPGIDNDNFT